MLRFYLGISKKKMLPQGHLHPFFTERMLVERAKCVYAAY
jgi:hypothetical protein